MISIRQKIKLLLSMMILLEQSAVLSFLIPLSTCSSMSAPTSSRRAAAAATTTAMTDMMADAAAAYQPYRGAQPADALSEIFVRQAVPDEEEDDNDELLWVPQTDTVSFRPLCLCVSGGYYVNLLRVKGAGVLSRHKHPGPVHGYVIKGRWKYLEHTWEAVPGSYVFEPPGEIHTLVVPPSLSGDNGSNDDNSEMITLFHVTGALLYCDPDGNVVGAEDVFTKLELAKKHYISVGLGEDFVQQFVR